MADHFTRLVFREGATRRIYLVGGYIRNILLARASTDRDFVVGGDVRDVAGNVASALGRRLVILGGDRLFRISLADGSTIDFSALEGNIETDLRRRDFTVNSIAWSPDEGIVDPNNGMGDLGSGLLRMISVDNLRADPVRLIRAYRLSAELCFAISPETRRAIKELSCLMEAQKYERITLEFFRILNMENPWKILGMMLEDDILDRIIICNNRYLQAQLKGASSLEQRLDVLPLSYSFRSGHCTSGGLTRRGLARLEYLLLGRTDVRLALSRKVMKNLLRIARGQSFMENLQGDGVLSKEALFDLIELLGDGAEDFFIVKGLHELLPICGIYREITGKGLLSTKEIVDFTGLREGRKLGIVIKALRRAEFTGKIKDRRGAVQLLSNINV